MLKFMLRRRVEYRNFAKMLKYLNRMVNGVYQPSIVEEGLWTREAVVER